MKYKKNIQRRLDEINLRLNAGEEVEIPEDLRCFFDETKSEMYEIHEAGMCDDQ